MADKITPTRVGGTPIGHFVAPKPQAFEAKDIKKGQKLQVSESEPVYVFIETRMGANTTIQGLNKKPFTCTPCERPGRVDAPRCMGQWYKIAVAQGAKVGKQDHVKLATTAMVKPGTQGRTQSVPFILEVAPIRYY
jgi:hypothetical protein